MNVTVRDLDFSDIPFVLDYWYESDPNFLTGMGVDLTKLGGKEEFHASLSKRIESSQSLPEPNMSALMICEDERPVGFHTISPLTVGESGVFHAHVFDSSMRGRGIGLRSYPLACQVFMNRFSLEKILFKTPLQNKAAIRVKEKLGLKSVGEELVSFGIYRDGVKTKVYELNREQVATFGY
ncbi:MAG: GNAT family protein [Pseudomonadota bacterium]